MTDMKSHERMQKPLSDRFHVLAESRTSTDTAAAQCRRGKRRGECQ
jgi:hypothetical protein